MSEVGIVLNMAAYVRSAFEPEGSVFYIGKTIGKEEAERLIALEKARKVSVVDTIGGYLDEKV